MTRYFLLCSSMFFFVHLVNGQSFIGLMGGGGLGQKEQVKGAIPIEWQKNEYLTFRLEPSFLIRQNQSAVRKINLSPEVFYVGLSYIELPAMVKLSLPIKEVQPYATLGVQVGYGIKMWYHYEDERRLLRKTIGFREAEINKFDGGLTFGVGLETMLRKKQKLFLDCRYYLGVVNIDKDSNNSLFNEGLILSIGCLFPIHL